MILSFENTIGKFFSIFFFHVINFTYIHKLVISESINNFSQILKKIRGLLIDL